MEETEESNGNTKCNTKTISRRTDNPSHKHHHHHHHHHQLIQYSNQFGFSDQNQYYQRYCYPSLLPLPPLIPLPLGLTPSLPQNHSIRSKTHLQKPSCKLNNTPFTASSETLVSEVSISPEASKGFQKQRNLPHKGENGMKLTDSRTEKAIVTAKRPDSGGVEGTAISLLANHFLVQFNLSQKIYHYNVEISPTPSKDIARMIKQKLVEDHSALLSGAWPAYDGRKNLYSSIEFQHDKLVIGV